MSVEVLPGRVAIINRIPRYETRMRQDYVTGFMINPETTQVLLIEKQRPEKQRGKWNGVGGKIEVGELIIEAMVREFSEETGIQTCGSDWTRTITLERPSYTVYFYRSFVREFPAFKQTTDEALGLFLLKSVFDGLPTLDNARWILPLQFAIGPEFPLHVKLNDVPSYIESYARNTGASLAAATSVLKEIIH